jgi:leucyl-tRNA synthetase
MHALSYQDENFDIKEPFEGLFTQGMVCHETYKDKNNNWVSPDELVTIEGKKYLKNNNSEQVIIGPSESMSKSKKNTIDPEQIIQEFGADSVRLFILSDSPPEKDVQWSDEGMKSSYKFIQKLWILNKKIINEIKINHPSSPDNSIEKISNQFVKNVTNNIENFSYNKIIANFHETYAKLSKIISNKIEKSKLIHNYKNILIAMSPVIPHFSSECLEMLGKTDEILWPKINEDILKDKKVNFVIQINGKTRAILEENKDITEETLTLKINENLKLKKYIEGKTIHKKIFIPAKLINIITS